MLFYGKILLYIIKKGKGRTSGEPLLLMNHAVYFMNESVTKCLFLFIKACIKLPSQGLSEL